MSTKPRRQFTPEQKAEAVRIVMMAQAGISVRPKRRFKPTTDSNHSFAIAPNVLKRNFTTTEPDQAWVADISYIPTLQGWLY